MFKELFTEGTLTEKIKWEDIDGEDSFVFYFEDGMELHFRKDGSKWQEASIVDGELRDWGEKRYEGYLSAQDIYKWLQQDYRDLPRLHAMEVY